jgi:hypothetical protein
MGVEHDGDVISIRAAAGGYIVQVCPPHSREEWSSAGPISAAEVFDHLGALGCRVPDVSHALDATGQTWRYEYGVEIVRRRTMSSDR